MAKHEPIFLKRACMEEALPKLLDVINEEADSKGVTVSFKVGVEVRTDLQNRLIHVWKGEIARFLHEDDFDLQFGEMKLQHLLPYKQVMDTHQDEAAEELAATQDLAKLLRRRKAFAHMEDYQVLCRAADICIRSKDQPVMLFARWLDKLQRFYGEQGLHLVASNYNRKALLTEKEQAYVKELEKVAA